METKEREMKTKTEKLLHKKDGTVHAQFVNCGKPNRKPQNHDELCRCPKGFSLN